jgi:hemophore-related protein
MAKDEITMTTSVISKRRRAAAVSAGCVLGGLAAATIAIPTASAAPDCSPGGVAGTVSSVTSAARGYLANHPGANQVITAAANQPRAEAEANVRGYFTAHQQEYNDLRGILAPLGDTQRQCNVTVVPANLSWAYDEFMAG